MRIACVCEQKVLRRKCKCALHVKFVKLLFEEIVQLTVTLLAYDVDVDVSFHQLIYQEVMFPLIVTTMRMNSYGGRTLGSTPE